MTTERLEVANANQQNSKQEQEIAQARAHIEAAAHILSRLSSDHRRVAWMLEDTLDILNLAVDENLNLSPPDVPVNSGNEKKIANIS